VLDKYLPQQLTDRPKQGFGSPIRQWLSGALRQWADELLSLEHLRQQGIFNAEYVHQLWQQCIKNPKKSHSRIWTILMFQAWHQKHCGN
jgi:asparagine synthase (glutamine-hydrolysing)